ncbi:putative quinol monooxygenase [Levilactobacillus tangyuanensis]|uniref:Quinol monooxygenase n=1 Tax=Levilactobacillus tangyuanensis TaxID=2486021 RepID=A0ABW1TMV3_9LACO|nr:antibiotic biosynthesis monooxygenase family protein [Levilactobacillus tangyuanensis]
MSEGGQPLFRLFKIKIDGDQQARFATVGRQNLLTSHANEPGTLAMYSTRLLSDPSEKRVIEMYRDEASYDVHAHSPQFAAFRSMAQDVVRESKVINLRPALVLERSEPLTATGDAGYRLELTEVTVKADQGQPFKKLLVDSQRHLFKTESEVLVTAVGQSMVDPQSWVIFRVSCGEAATQAAVDQDYQRQVANLVDHTETVQLAAETLVTQGGLSIID